MNVRRAVVAAALADAEAEALLVTALPNVRWLTGFTGSNGAVYLHADGRELLVTDDRYTERAAEEAPGIEVRADRTWGWLAEVHPAGHRLALEAPRIHWATVLELAELVGRDRLVPTHGLVESRRQIKDDAEIAALRRACAITDDAFADLCTWLQPGITERDAAARLERTMQDLGAAGPAFATILASGPNGSRPHHDPGARTLQAGDLVTIDFGALVDGYHADMTRTVALGTPPAELAAIHDLVRRAQQAGVDAAVPGRPTGDVDAACRTLISDEGHGEHFPHGTGHGVGLEIHEQPFLHRPGSTPPGARGQAATLRARMTVTVEPGVYLPGTGGVRIEDVVLIGESGAERLTTSPRDLITL